MSYSYAILLQVVPCPLPPCSKWSLTLSRPSLPHWPASPRKGRITNESRVMLFTWRQFPDKIRQFPDKSSPRAGGHPLPAPADVGVLVLEERAEWPSSIQGDDAPSTTQSGLALKVKGALTRHEEGETGTYHGCPRQTETPSRARVERLGLLPSAPGGKLLKMYYAREASEHAKKPQIYPSKDRATGFSRRKQLGLPWWLSGKESASQCRRQGCGPPSRKIPHATEQLSQWTAAIKPVLQSAQEPQLLKTTCSRAWAQHQETPPPPTAQE